MHYRSVSTQVPDEGVLVLPKTLIEQHMSNLHYHAWSYCGSESNLYPLYSLILTLASLNTQHPNEPRVSLISWPQAFFGEVPRPGDEGDDPSDPSAKKSAKEPKERLLPPFRTPDFARILIFADSDDSDEEALKNVGMTTNRDISDFFELKRLNTDDPWWTDEVKTRAEAEIPQWLAQVYDTAMAGFAYNPKWKTVYAVLVIGVYFTQLRWNSRPSVKVLEPIIKTKVPKAISKGVPYKPLIDKLLREINQYSTRAIPDITFFNESVFEYRPSQSDSQHYRPMSLSKAFLYALYKPTTRFSQLSSHSSSLFEAEQNKPRMPTGVKSVAQTLLKNILVAKPIRVAKDSARALGHRFPGDPEPTPTPPNSSDQGYKPTVKNVNKLPKPHMKTRFRGEIFGEDE